MSSAYLLRKNFTIEELLDIIWKLPSDKQLALADKVRKKALSQRWNDFINDSGDAVPDISMDEIVAEVKSARAARYARRKK